MIRWLLTVLLSILAAAIYGHILFSDTRTLPDRLLPLLIVTLFFSCAYSVLYLSYFSEDNFLKRLYRNERVRMVVVMLCGALGGAACALQGFKILSTGTYYLEPRIGYPGTY